MPSAAAPIIISGGADGAAAATGSTLPAVAGGAAAAVLIGCAVAIALLMRRRRDKKKLSRVKSEVAALRDFQKEAVASQRSLALALSEISALRETVAASTNPMHTAQAGSFSRLEPAAGLTGSSRAAAAAAAATMATPAQPRAVDAAEQHLSLARTPSERRAFSAVKRAEPPLAPGWKEASGTSGTPYWRNESTGLTSFSRPTVAGAPSPQAPQPAAAGDAPLLPGWTEHFSKSTGKNYWRHGDSGETTWTRPAVAAAAATEAAAAPGASLPPGWGERFSNSQQRPYWFTLSDPSRTVWERPTAPA